MGADEEGTRVKFNSHFDEVIQPAISNHRGRLVKTMGDGFLVEFGSVVDAVQCAADIQNAAASREVEEAQDNQMLFRIGIHLGDVIVEGEDIHGDGINIAARLEGLADPGGICISGMVHEGVRNKLDVELSYLGEKPLKNIAEAVHVYRVGLGGSTDERKDTSASDAIFRRPAVAVLPFENMSGDPEQDYFADGLTEDIITALSLYKFFPVIARNSTFAYKGQTPDIREVGKELGARYIIEGSVRKAGNRVRVTAQLINSQTGHHIWADRFDRDLDDVFMVQDELTERIAGIIAPELDRSEQKLAHSKAETNLNAWEHVQRGIALLNKMTAEGNVQAREEFNRALELDPDYSRAYSGLSWSHHRDLHIFKGKSREETLTKTFETARRAVALDPSDSLAHIMLGIALQRAENFDESLAAFQHAIDLNPSDASGYISRGLSLSLSGRPDEGVASLEKGFQLNPKEPRNSLYFAFMARAHLTARRYAEAADWARKSIRWQSDTIIEPYLILAASLGHLGQLQDAKEALEKCQQLDPKLMASKEDWIRYKRVADSEHFLDGLRKAGWEG
jgi:adenylate cyclase